MSDGTSNPGRVRYRGSGTGTAAAWGSAGGGAVGAQEGGDAAADDAVGLGVAELDGPHHGLVVDLAERQGG